MNHSKNFDKVAKIRSLFVLFIILLILPFLNSNLFYRFIEKNNSNLIGDNDESLGHNVRIAQGESILFQGTETTLNITDSGNLYDLDQEIMLTNQEELNLTYPLDEEHDWKISKINVSINDIQDTRNWVNDSDFLLINMTEITRVYEVHENDRVKVVQEYFYDNDLDKSTSMDEILQLNAVAIRAHFLNISLENEYDFVKIDDSEETLYYQNTGSLSESFYSPWVKGDNLTVYIESDSSNRDYGYYIDYYEYVNGTIIYDYGFA